MATTTADVQAELATKNAIDLPPVPDELISWAQENPIYIYNVGPERHEIEHPLVGRVVINPCPAGEAYSQPTVIPGLLPYGVRTDMNTGEIKHESGRQFVVDILGVGQFKNQRYSLIRRGVFIASNDTFDAEKSTTFKIGKGRITLPEWVNLKKGECSDKPTKKEIAQANKMLEKLDFETIAEANALWDKGPGKEGQESITEQHRYALRRRNKTADWDKPQETLVDCDGCGDKIRPNVVKHSCGAVRDAEKALALNMITKAEYDAMKQSKKEKVA